MKSYILLVMLVIASNASAQLNGIVYGSDTKNKEPIFGAKVYFLGTRTGTTTDEDGKFEVILPRKLPDTMVISAMGYYSDTIVVDKSDRYSAMEITLFSDLMMPDVIVEVKKSTHSVNRMKTLHVEEIGSGELRKAACCNLSESFETNVSVDVNITDAVSGAKKIQMMGLDGVYTQLQMENMPYLRGLETSFGLNSMPGTWIESIQITKGTGNVVNGYESMAGLVNIELKKPEEMERLYLNFYGNSMGRSELNFNSGFQLNEKWSSGWFAHASAHPIEMDYNNDGFRDMPNGNNFAFLNRYQFEGKKMESRFGYNLYWDRKDGGQITDLRNQNYYGVLIDSKHADVFAKTGFFMKKPYNSIGVVYNFKYQDVKADIGNHSFVGTEKRGYINAIFDGIIGNTDHKIKVGLSGVYVDFKQQMDSLNDDRLELVPGVFSEYTYTGTRISAVAGLRGDYHNLFGFQFLPRIHTKFILNEYIDLRLTGGKGWRVPNYMIDNVSLLANSRTWVAPTQTKQEISWNMGGSYVHRFKIGKQRASFTMDYYYTFFENQLIVDRDEDMSKIIFKNLEGKSFSNSLQAELDLPVSKSIDIRLAYKFLDVRAEFGGQLQQKVMVPKHRGFINVAYKSRNKRWEYDFTTSVFGNSRLPIALLTDSSLSTINESNVWPMVSTQLTHVYKKWDFYLGIENLLNYTQKDPIIDAANPFGETFDATRIWAPVYGINAYFGIRYSIQHKDELSE